MKRLFVMPLLVVLVMSASRRADASIGTFFDWLQELRDISPDADNALIIRLVLLGVLAVVLGGLVVTKVALRWLREFNDGSLALVPARVREVGSEGVPGAPASGREAFSRGCA